MSTVRQPAGHSLTRWLALAVAGLLVAVVAVVAATGSAEIGAFLLIGTFGLAVVLAVAIQAFRPLDESVDDRSETRPRFELPTL